MTNIKYLEVLTRCEKCGEHYCRRQSKKCPHKFSDIITQLLAEGKVDEALKVIKKSGGLMR